MAIEAGAGLLTIISAGKLWSSVDPVDFEINGTPDIKKAYALKGGKKVNRGTYSLGASYDLKISVEAMTWTAMQIANSQVASLVTTYTMPTTKRAIVGALGVVAEPGLLDLIVYASLTRSADPTLGETFGEVRPLTRVTTTPATVAEFKVDTTAKTLTFHSSLIGVEIEYVYNTILSNVPAIGVDQSPVSLDTISFTGITYGDAETGRYFINIKKATLASIPSFNHSDLVKAEMIYSIVALTNNPLPYEKIKLPGY